MSLSNGGEDGIGDAAHHLFEIPLTRAPSPLRYVELRSSSLVPATLDNLI